MGYVSTGMADGFSALLKSLMALRLTLVCDYIAPMIFTGVKFE